MEVDLLTWFISVIPLQCECVCGSQQGRPDESRDQPALCCGMAAVAAAAAQRSIATLTSITILNASAVLFDWVVRSNSISFKRLVTVDVCLPGLARASQPASSYARSLPSGPPPPLLCRANSVLLSTGTCCGRSWPISVTVLFDVLI